jgi:LmbE family N-acetylglucosaminyl deacetylase
LDEKGTLLAIFAHPDDESLLIGGTVARLVDEGWSAALICATRGEWGPISDEALANYETLGEVRERELRDACQVLGVRWLRFLDLMDGGVEAILGKAEEEPILELIVHALRELRPRLVLTFGPDGLYGHPDHIAIGALTTQACALAADPNAFPEQNLAPFEAPSVAYATAPKGYYPALLEELGRHGYPIDLWGIPPERFGVPPEAITTTLDITPFLDRKLAALRCHRTQLDEKHALTFLPYDIASRCFHQEFWVEKEI